MLTIGDVIVQLKNISDTCYQRSSRQGYFASLYLAMTKAVEAAMRTKSFSDASRMEALDIAFAKRYIDAFNNYQQGELCAQSWQLAFKEAGSSTGIVLQHLLLGINAHINYDLAPAAAGIAAGDKIFELQQDFDAINNIIETLSVDVQNKLGKIWWPLPFLTRLSAGKEKVVLDFSIKKARQASWANAVALAMAKQEAWPAHLKLTDDLALVVGQRIARPGMLVRSSLKLVRSMEPASVKELITLLQEE